MPNPHKIAPRRPIAANRLIEAINPKGRSTTYTYDTLDRLNRSDALGGTTQLSYDANDNLVQATDRKGHVTTLQYDALNRPSQISTADGCIPYSYRTAHPAQPWWQLGTDPMITPPMVPLTCVVF